MFSLRGPSYIICAVLLGVVGALIVTLGIDVSTAVPPAFMLGLPVVLAVVWKPRLGMLGLILLMCFLEEVPGGIIGPERAARTFFYSLTLGLPAVYAPDLIITGLLVLYAVKFILHREAVPLELDKIGAGLLFLFASVLVSVLISFGSYQTFGPDVLPGNFGFFEGAQLPEAIARLVAILQLKLYVIIFPSYLLGLFFFRTRRDLDQALLVFSIAMVGTIFLAMYRLVSNPSMVAMGITVIVDTVTIWLLGCAVFYTISRWVCGHYTSSQTTVRVICAGFFVILILLSFRRTLWGAMALAFLFWPVILPRRSWGRLLFLIAVGIIVAGAFFAFTPIGQVVIGSVLRRAGETTSSEGSTQYRLAMAFWIIQSFGDITAFGKALSPLWDTTVQIRRLEVTMEGVHSLYLWILMRFGFVGFGALMLSCVLTLLRMREVYKQLDDERLKLLAGVTFLSFIVLIFNGILNPIYGQVRQMVLFGIELALITRLPAMCATVTEQSKIIGSKNKFTLQTPLVLAKKVREKTLPAASKLQTAKL